MLASTYRHRVSISQAAGRGDYRNAGSPVDVISNFHVRRTDTAAQRITKIRRGLLSEIDAHDWDQRHVGSDEARTMNAGQRRGLLVAWALGWAKAASRDVERHWEQMDRDEW